MDCFNRINDTAYKPEEVTVEPDLCEGCGTIKPCIVFLRPPSLIDRLKGFFKGLGS